MRDDPEGETIDVGPVEVGHTIGPRPAGEPTPHRDVGPYSDASQPLRQYAAQTFGMPLPNENLCHLVVGEAAMLTGVKMSDFESDYLREWMSHGHDPILATIIAAWMFRAHHAGLQKGRNL